MQSASPIIEVSPQPVGLERLAFTVPDTATMLGGVCHETVRRLAKRGKLRPVKGLRHLLFTRKEIERFLAQ
jgi:hypothetical protein